MANFFKKLTQAFVPRSIRKGISSLINPGRYMARQAASSTNEAHQLIAQQQAQINQQSKMADAAFAQRKVEVEQAQARLVDGTRRAQRRRVRGGLFGDNQPGSGPQSNPRLG